MDETDRLAEQFEQHRPRLKAVAYRMLGSQAEADDAVQDTWLPRRGSSPAGRGAGSEVPTSRRPTPTWPSSARRPTVLDGAAGVVATVDGRPFSVMGFTVTNGKIAEIYSLLDPDRIGQLDLTIVD